MNNKGFVSSSMMYSFLLVFILSLVLLLNMYTTSRANLETRKVALKESLTQGDADITVNIFKMVNGSYMNVDSLDNVTISSYVSSESRCSNGEVIEKSGNNFSIQLGDEKVICELYFSK